MAARRRAKAEPSVAAARRKSLDFLADNGVDDGADDRERRREMVARRLSYQHKSDFNLDADEAPYYENTRENPRPRSPGYAIVV